MSAKVSLSSLASERIVQEVIRSANFTEQQAEQPSEPP